MRVTKVTSRGQITIPIDIRTTLGITEDTYLEVVEAGGEIKLRKIHAATPLGDDDPIWDLVGIGESGHRDVAREHDRHLAEGEAARWRESS